jgi:hypothetical protein
MKFVETLASYLPSVIVDHLIKEGEETVPSRQRQVHFRGRIARRLPLT